MPITGTGVRPSSEYKFCNPGRATFCFQGFSGLTFLQRLIPRNFAVKVCSITTRNVERQTQSALGTSLGLHQEYLYTTMNDTRSEMSENAARQV